MNEYTMTDIKLDYSKISNVQIGGLDIADYPDFCDAYIESADYGDREMTEEELYVLNEDGYFISEEAHKSLY
jgi:hypothetical protein